MICPKCSHEAECDASHETVRCSECESIIAHGVLMPRVVVEPDADRRFVVVRFDSTEYRLEREYGKAVAVNIASLCK